MAAAEQPGPTSSTAPRKKKVRTHTLYIAVIIAVVAGAVLGLVAYATWNLTNLAVLDGYPSGSVLYDLAWGTVGTAATCGLTFVVSRRVRALR